MTGPRVKHPDQEVRARLELVFTTFLQVKAACQVSSSSMITTCCCPAVTASATGLAETDRSAILSILESGVCGAFIGRTRAMQSHRPARTGSEAAHGGMENLSQGKYPPYIDWDTFATIRR